MSESFSFISTNVTELAPPLTANALIKTCLLVLNAKHAETERFAARLLGANRFRSKRKANRERLLACAARLAQPFRREGWPPPSAPTRLYFSPAMHAHILFTFPSMALYCDAYKPI